MFSDLIDLHCHSTASDGRLTPAQLVEHAKQLGLKALALTDHDTIVGLGMFHTAGRTHGIETVSGVEISVDYPTGAMHMLGLFIDPQNQSFRAFLKQLSDGRMARNPQIISKLNQLGFAITLEEVEAEARLASDGSIIGSGTKSVGRPHIAAVMIKKGYVPHKQAAFDTYLAKGRPAYEPRFVADPEESIAQIHSAAGLAILAHPPYLLAKSHEETEAVVAELKGKGLDGIEVYFSTHTPEQTALCARLAKQYDLAVSGGSDFHGEAGRGGMMIELGSGVNGTLRVTYDVLEQLRARKTQRRTQQPRR